MGKNEIKLRRQMLDAGDIGRYRNYPALMRQHERAKRAKRNVRIFTYSILVTLIILLFLIIISFMMFRWEKKRELRNKENIQTSAINKVVGDHLAEQCSVDIAQNLGTNLVPMLKSQRRAHSLG